jgi:hypothetical protein
MTNTTITTLRDRYFANEIFRIGELVEDTKTGEKMKILDRGSNYVTVATSAGVIKKWLNEVTEEVIIEQVDMPVQKPANFVLLESGQVKLFGYETRNFDNELSTLMLEQFEEFDDLYSQHQIVKCLDLAIQENDSDTAYSLLEKVCGFYTKHNITTPFIVESLKTDIERKRISEILATVAGITPEKSNYKTVVASIKALRAKYQSRKQWEVLWPFLKMAQDSGLSGILVNLPFNFDNETVNESDIQDEELIEILESNIDLIVEDFDFDDVDATFTEEEFSGELISEVLSIEDRVKLSRKLRQHTPMMAVKRERALGKAASTNVLLDRARRLAELMLKRRMFHKDPTSLSRQEKERFEAGASKRSATVAKLAQRLVSKVRALQSTRLHHTATPATHTHDRATAAIAASHQVGAS